MTKLNQLPRGGLTQDRLKEVIDYDADTGLFLWKKKPTRTNNMEGKIAGYPQWGSKSSGGGYIRIMIDFKVHLAHRLAWLYIHGEWPKYQLDHKDGDRANNRLSNLRECTVSQNRMNAPRENKYGRGVFFRNDKRRTKQWGAQISANGKHIYLGAFLTQEEAQIAYIEASRKIHGEFSLNESRSA